MARKTPRYYQVEAVKAACISCTTPSENSENGFEIPYIDAPPGSGKSLMQAMLIDKVLRQGGRAISFVHRAKITRQNYNEVLNYVENAGGVGLCCRKLKSNQIHKQAVICMYQSFLNQRTKAGQFNLCIIDECHLVSNKAGSGYRKIIRSLLRFNPKMKIICLSGTPSRYGQGALENSNTEGKALMTTCCYSIDVKRLIKEGHLSNMESLSGNIDVDLSGVKMSGMDYNKDQIGVKFDAIIDDAIADVKAKFEAYGIKTALIFASNIKNATHILNAWGDNDQIRLITCDSTDDEQEAAEEWMETGAGTRIIINVGIYTTGYDYDALDCVVLLRATAVYELYKQMVTRAIRAHEDKEKGYVIDYGTNIERHGPIDESNPPKPKLKKQDAPKKLCLECNHTNILSAKYCANPECRAQFISSEDGKYSMRSQAEILRIKEEKKIIEHEVSGVEYVKCFSKKDGTPMIKMLFYDIDSALICEKYLMLNHKGFAKDDSDRFLMSMFKNPKDFYKMGTVGVTVDNIYKIIYDYPDFFKKFKTIWIKPDGNFKNIVGVEFL